MEKKNRVYASFAKVAGIDGKKGSVTVAHAEGANITAIIDDGNTTLALTAIYARAGGVKAKITTISFPPDTQDIIYDPTIGSGDYIQESDAKTLIMSLLLLVVALFI